jgi:hypothetical protein
MTMKTNDLKSQAVGMVSTGTAARGTFDACSSLRVFSCRTVRSREYHAPPPLHIK